MAASWGQLGRPRGLRNLENWGETWKTGRARSVDLAVSPWPCRPCRLALAVSTSPCRPAWPYCEAVSPWLAAHSRPARSPWPFRPGRTTTTLARPDSTRVASSRSTMRKGPRVHSPRSCKSILASMTAPTMGLSTDLATEVGLRIACVAHVVPTTAPTLSLSTRVATDAGQRLACFANPTPRF